MVNKNRKIAVLGSTGSIGTQTLSCAKEMGLEVTLLTAFKSIDLLEKQIREFSPSLVAVADIDAAHELRLRVSDTNTRIFSGMDGILEAIDSADFDIAVNGIVGMAGMLPTYRCVRRGKTVALANKESLVVAGDIILKTASENHAEILTVDSEHSAVFQCLNGINPTKDDTADRILGEKLSRIILTASGGAFWGMTSAELEKVTAESALKHPNWKMGSKITIDCATMMNKGFEIIEAMYLFGVPDEKIDVLVHRESIVHSMIETVDGSVLAQLSVPDMRLAIQYALTYPNRSGRQIDKLDLAKIAKLTFYEPDYKTFPAPLICRAAKKTGGTATAVLNASNEIAVERFLKGDIRYPKIVEFVERALNDIPLISTPTLEDILEIDRKTRLTVEKYI
ncbi:MAG: 1-deoxy-D-xylulose-5-phosphate reductoisomerase [Clostridia bacterium]|nr:1-deoxy-D-xylulose-5-phosphate reductoisomerase [Clostridia bacterium]